MEPIGYGLQLAGEAEVDRAMDVYHREQAERDAAERARLDGLAARDQSVHVDGADESEVTLLPIWQVARASLLEGMRPKRRPGEPSVIALSPTDREKPTPIAAPTDTHDGPIKYEIEAAPLPVETKSRTAITLASGETDFLRFPVTDVLTVKEYADPLRAMTELCQQLLMHKDYARVRGAYCHNSIRLNLVGRLAPGWRPQLKSGEKWGAAIHKVIHRDQVVIDLHWCHATKMPMTPNEPDHLALLGEGVEFQFDLAWMLAGKVWKSEFRAAEALCLTTFQQCQLLKLRGPEVAAFLKGVGAGWYVSGGKSVSKIAAVKREIGQWAERNKRIQPQRDSYGKLWLAREVLGRDTPKQQIAELHALMMGGEVQDRASIRDKLKSLDKNVRIT